MFGKIARTSFLLVAALTLLTSYRFNPNNPPVSKTGAPGENTCAQSGCHAGGTFSGSVAVSGVPDTVELDKTYTVTITQTSNATRGGYQLTSLDNSNARCGTLTAAAGSSIGTNNTSGRQYARQSSPKSFSGATSISWNFSWKTPATAPTGNRATFFFASLAANGDGEKTGDNVLLGTKAYIFAGATSDVAAPTQAFRQCYVDAAQKTLYIELEAANTATLRIFDLQGRPVMDKTIGSQEAIPLADLATGIYVAQIHAKGVTSSRKFAL
jgi:hypothetical protein